MSTRKVLRDKKRQYGQFMTPPALASKIVGMQNVEPDAKVLEPSFGDGSFLISIIEHLMGGGEMSNRQRFMQIMREQVYGVEIDPELFRETIASIESRWGTLPADHHLICDDFFRTDFPVNFFNHVIGNPPFGGTFDSEIEDALDKQYGRWRGHKVKKETYSFFIAKSLDLIAPNGKLTFIVSDTFLTINTMIGLRHRLVDECSVDVEHLAEFSNETVQPMVLLRGIKQLGVQSIVINGVTFDIPKLFATENFSWGLTSNLTHYFDGPTLASYVTCSSGMTVGKNEYFLREIVDGKITEAYSFSFIDEPITLRNELAKARLGKLSPASVERIRTQELAQMTRRNVRVVTRPEPITVALPSEDYQFYNKSDSGILYSPPKWAIFWKDDGDAVITFKKNGNWYLRGVGGKPFFKREGFTWQLIAPSLRVRYLPPGYILDSGAPCGFLRPDVPEYELWFIIGWLQTELASTILKKVINHTRNIQSKDLERLPYPWWVDAVSKRRISHFVQSLVEQSMAGRVFSKAEPEIIALNDMFAMMEQNISECARDYSAWQEDAKAS